MRAPIAPIALFALAGLLLVQAQAQGPGPFVPGGAAPGFAAALAETAADPGLAEERRLYWLKCSGARQSLRRSRTHALLGVGLFLANAPLEYSISRVRHRGHREPAALNAAAFVLMGASLLNLAWSRVHDARYERERACCRLWQEYARVE